MKLKIKSNIAEDQKYRIKETGKIIKWYKGSLWELKNKTWVNYTGIHPLNCEVEMVLDPPDTSTVQNTRVRVKNFAKDDWEEALFISIDGRPRVKYKYVVTFYDALPCGKGYAGYRYCEIL